MDPLLFHRRLSIAPMLDWTDRHERYFLRRLSRHVLLYSEMIPCGALLHGNPERFLRHHADERPVALQLGGSHPRELALCARIAQDFGYDEINLNCGCPSDRVQSGRFGACLMGEKNLVAECVAAMKNAVRVPVTVKTRIGMDEMDGWDFLYDFVDTVQKAGVDHWIIHARKAWLQGLSPKENREIPPLNYARVCRLQKTFPAAHFTLNGGVSSLDMVLDILRGNPIHGMDYSECDPLPLKGVMIGRAVYENPWILRDADLRVFEREGCVFSSRSEFLHSLRPYIERQLREGTPLHHMTKHLLGLFSGIPGARAYRRWMGEGACRDGAGWEVVERALSCVRGD